MKRHLKKTTQYRQHIVVQGMGNGFVIESNEHMTDSDIKAEILAQVSQVLDEAFANPRGTTNGDCRIHQRIRTEWDEESQAYVERLKEGLISNAM